LTASDGVQSASTSATWTVRNTDYILLSPGDQSNNEGDDVSLDLQSLWGSAYAGINTQAPLIFSAYNLPAGLTLDPTTGIIRGTIASNIATAEQPQLSLWITITLVNQSDGDTSTVSFHWLIQDNPNLGEPPAGSDNGSALDQSDGDYTSTADDTTSINDGNTTGNDTTSESQELSTGNHDAGDDETTSDDPGSTADHETTSDGGIAGDNGADDEAGGEGCAGSGGDCTGGVGDQRDGTGPTGAMGDGGSQSQETSTADGQGQDDNILSQVGLSLEYQNWLWTHGFFGAAVSYAVQGKKGKEIEDALLNDDKLGAKFKEALQDRVYPPPPEERRFVQVSNSLLDWQRLKLPELQDLIGGTSVETRLLPIVVFDPKDPEARPFGFSRDDKAVKEALEQAGEMLFVVLDRDANKLVVYRLTNREGTLGAFLNSREVEKINEVPVKRLRDAALKAVGKEAFKLIDFESGGPQLSKQDIGRMVGAVYDRVVKQLLPPEKFPVASLAVVKEGFTFRIDPDPQKIVDGSWFVEQGGRVLIQRQDISNILPTKFGLRLEYAYLGKTYDLGLIAEGSIRNLGEKRYEGLLTIGILFTWGGKRE